MADKKNPSVPSPSAAEQKGRAQSEQGPLLYLEILRGRTRFPRRPVIDRRFLIGGDGNCQLRLGGDDVPPLHSILHVDGRDVWLDALADAPPLTVNGRVERSVRLREDDTVRIGSIEFVVRCIQAERVEKPEHEAPTGEASRSGNEATEAPDPDAKKLSVAQLVERLEREQQLVEEFETGRQRGAESLLHVARARAESLVANRGPAGSTEPAAASTGVVAAYPTRKPVQAGAATADDLQPRLLEEIEELIRHLNQFSDELDRRAEDLTDREASDEQAAAALLDAQQTLAAQLDRVLTWLETHQTGQPQSVRAIA